jgi:hypothetical protein
VSPHVSSRLSTRRRSSPEENPKPAALSPWHVVGIGLIALLGTGILAAVDRLQQGAAAARASIRPPLVKSDGQPAKVAEARSPAPIVEVHRPAVPAPGLPAPRLTAPAPATAEPRQERPVPIASVVPNVTEASAYQPAVAPASIVAAFLEQAQPAPIPSASANGRAPRSSDGPAITASLTPPTPPVRQLESATSPPASAKGGVKLGAAAPTECLPPGLRAVLADVAARFGDISVVSTHQLNTANHSSGSIREKLHHACNAVDFRPDRERVEEVKKYLRGRPEIGGVESYRNGVVHMDLKGSEVASASARPRRQATAQAAAAEVPQSPPPPQAPEPSGWFRFFGR